MSASLPRSALREITISIAEERRDALLSALRRGARGEALDLLAGWTSLFHGFGPDGFDPDDEWCPYVDQNQIELTEWTRDEVRLHVEDGRFQHALALLDRYLTLPPVFTHADDRARLEKMQS